MNQKQLIDEFADFMRKSGKSEADLKSYLIKRNIDSTDAERMAAFIARPGELSTEKRTDYWNLFAKN